MEIKISPEYKPTPPQEYLKTLLDYDPTTGKLIWREKSLESCGSTREFNRWNGRHKGKPAFTTKDKSGYYHGTIDSVRYLAHRVIYKLFYGIEPEFIDHDDGNPSNNRISNLISATRKENNSNTKKRSDNKSGVVGVIYHKGKQKWEAYINHNNKRYGLGSYTNIEDAIKARKEAEVLYGFNPNHGR